MMQGAIEFLHHLRTRLRNFNRKRLNMYLLPPCFRSRARGRDVSRLRSTVPNFRYRALTQAGEIVSGSIAAPTAAEVARRIEYLGLVPIDTVTEERHRRPALS